ncbi:MAG: GntR family transcriptional regulator [Desulfobacteraceae bacterium]|nr:MAG: GntR family transcriptional regulator [Desulfobacteraceae bacterium]
MGKKTKRDVVYKALKKQIHSGYLLPGTRLIELDLSSQFKISRTIVREVIKQLTIEGQLNVVPYKGATVAKISVRDLEENYRIQQDLEGLATFLSTERLPKKQIAEMERICQSSKDHNSQDVAGWQEWNIRFHGILIKNCGNRHLIELIKSYREQFARYWFPILSIPGSIEIFTEEHYKITEAVKARKPALARDLIEQHLGRGIKQIIEMHKNAYHPSL